MSTSLVISFFTSLSNSSHLPNPYLFAQIQFFNLLFYMNIFVAGLTYQITEHDLRELFEEYGTVSSAKIITDRFSGRSRGFGFVEMEDEAEGHKAIEQLNDAEFDGRTLTVDVAKPRKERENRY